jgi:SAM-dependent methyltransferase
MTLRPVFNRVRGIARGALATATRPLARLGYNRLCNVEDFEHPRLRPLLRDIFRHQLERVGPDFPLGRETRKEWEVAMAARTLGDFGVLHTGAEILGVGAGHEPTVFWLTNRVGRVFATDLYLEPGVWKEFCNSSMLTDPGCHWPSPWDPRRLIVQHMNALELRHPDATFDGVFSSSSIEHFGGPAEVRRSIEEIHRVLKPGGIASLSTEFRVEGPGPGIPGTLLFDEREIRALFLDGPGWELLSPLDLGISPATRASERPVMEYIDDFHAHFARHGQVVFHELDFSHYPQVLLRHGEHLFTSLHLALRKRDG